MRFAASIQKKYKKGAARLKKLTALVLSLVFAFGLGGCKSKPDGTGDTPELGEISHYTLCDNGTLIDFDHFDDTHESYPQGKSITVQDTGTLYWAPWDEEEDIAAASAEVAFTVLGRDDAVIYEGTLSIARGEETKFGAIYSAALEGGPELTLVQDEHQRGGILTQLAT